MNFSSVTVAVLAELVTTAGVIMLTTLLMKE